MPQTIDFDVTARRIAELTDLARVREQLVLIWNARGAVDTATIELTLSTTRCVDERGARYVAQAFMQDTMRAGWIR